MSSSTVKLLQMNNFIIQRSVYSYDVALKEKPELPRTPRLLWPNDRFFFAFITMERNSQLCAP